MKKIIFTIIFLSCFLQANSFDIGSIGTINSSVIDEVGVLKIEEKTLIETKIQELRNKYTTEILLVIIPSTNGEEIGTVATEIGQKIGVGKADKDNGVVILIAIDDRAWDIATGYGVEGVLPDLLTKRIGENNFVLFKESRYFDGIMGSLSDFDKAFSGDTSIISTKNYNNSSEEKETFWIAEIIFFMFMTSLFFKPFLEEKKYKKFIIYFLIAYLITLPITYYFSKMALNPIILNTIISIFGTIIGIFWSFGKGRYNNSGGGGSSSGGGFGGFGGGGFGGGGSSGKW